MKTVNKYIKLTDECFPKPPANVHKIIRRTLSKYPVDFVLTKDAGVMVVKLNKNLYGISNLAVNPSKQGKGIGTRLMQKVHSKYKGIFILKSRYAKDFYKRLGYIQIGKIMVYVNGKIGW